MAVLAGEIGERHVWRPSALQAAAQYVGAEFSSLGYQVVPQAYHASGVRCENLEVTVKGAAHPSEIIVVGAHYDTVAGSPGADDNASGVAGVIEIARALAQLRLARTVKLAVHQNRAPASERAPQQARR